MITRREFLIGLAVLVGVSTLAVSLTGLIREASERKYLAYQQALKVTEADKFAYGLDTNVGNILATGQVKATENQAVPEIKGEWAIIGRETERYTRHTRQDCTTDSEGNTTCTTEVYYQWDHWASDYRKSPAYTVLGRQVPVCEPGTRTIGLKDAYVGNEHREGDYVYPVDKWWPTEGDIRYYWEAMPTEWNATVFARAFDGQITDPQGGRCVKWWQDRSIEQVVEQAEPNNALIAWLFIGLVILSAGGWFYAAYQNDIC